MSQLSYWTGGCVLEFMKAKDIPSFTLVCKKFRGFCDEKAIKTLFASRFKEIQLDLDFDVERKFFCKVKSDIQWLCILEENLSLIMSDKPSLIIHSDMWWAQCGGTNTNQLSKVLSEKFGLDLPNSYKIVDVAIVKMSDYETGEFAECAAVIVQPPTDSDTELWLSRENLEYDLYRSDPIDKFDCFQKVDLPVGCKNLMRIFYSFDGDTHLLSNKKIPFFWKVFGSGDIVRLRCLEPVFK
eukprot:Platyproteum_vivax@DN7464_c2_g3_i2.p1